MQKKHILWALICVLLLLPFGAFAEEDGDAIGFVDPTRNPNASEYSTQTPWELQDDQIVAYSFVLMERSKQNILKSRDEDVARFPASTTKILTCLMALEYCEDLGETLEITSEAMDIPPDSSKVPFKKGEIVTLRDALYGMMLRSGNEAANAVAIHIAGDIPTFIQRMNETAAMLGCTNTHFTNAHGYHDEAHYTTARDLAIIMDAAMDNETFRQIISSPTYDLSATRMNPSRKIQNSNLHIREGDNYYYKWSIGGKTGFHSQAGYVLVEAAEQNGVQLIAVAMYASKYSRWPDTSRLFAFGFSQYDSITPIDVYNDSPTILQINGFDPASEGYGEVNSLLNEEERLGRLKLNILPVDPGREVRITDLTEEIEAIRENFNMYTNVRWLRDMRAPITMGEVMGILTFYPDGQDEAEYELIASRSISARPNAPPSLEDIERRVEADPSPFPPFGWDWILPPVLTLLAIIAALWLFLSTVLRKRKRKKQIPTPKRRYFS